MYANIRDFQMLAYFSLELNNFMDFLVDISPFSSNHLLSLFSVVIKESRIDLTATGSEYDEQNQLSRQKREM